MDDFNKIGLLDFQSRGGQFTPLFNNFSQNSGFLPFKEQPLLRYNQNPELETVEDAKHIQRSSSSKIKTCNLEELMSNCSLMYVSGDSHGLDPTKLQLEFCTNDCCSSRVKYARVHRDKESDIWSNNNNNRFNAIAPLPGASAARSSWDLGSDGASTPGSNSWGDMFGAVGPVTSGRSATQWPQAGDFGFGSNNVFLDGRQGGDTWETGVQDTWAACDALLLETDNIKAFGENQWEDVTDYNDQWSKISKKSRKPKL